MHWYVCAGGRCFSRCLSSTKAICKRAFSGIDTSVADGVFMDLDELCGTTAVAAVRQPDPASDSRPVAMEKLVHELISDRLLTLSRYITLDSSTRTILIDQTSLSADGYQVVTH